MKKEEHCKFLSGPYDPPKSRRGGFLFCEMRGTVKVGGYSDGLIPWPVKWRTRSLILCGDLVKAVRHESRAAVAYHWGVAPETVKKWRRALDVEIYNPGSMWVMRATAHERATPRRIREMCEQARQVTRVPKSKEWKRLMSRLVRGRIARSGAIHPDRPLWTKDEDKLLGTDTDARVAEKLGRSAVAVRSRRAALGIPLKHRIAPDEWTHDEEKLLGVQSDADVARMLGRNERGVQLRRQMLGIPAFRQKRRPWTAREERLLGTMPDRELARKLKRPLQTIQIRRHLKGIPNPDPIRRMWTKAEDRLLGAKPDEEVAKAVGRTVNSVLHRRSALGIPNPAPKRKFWTPGEMKLLGTAPDKQIAARLGCPVRTVTTKRVHLGIRAF